jgi:hypothetical protein
MLHSLSENKRCFEVAWVGDATSARWERNAMNKMKIEKVWHVSLTSRWELLRSFRYFSLRGGFGISCRLTETLGKH